MKKSVHNKKTITIMLCLIVLITTIFWTNILLSNKESKKNQETAIEQKEKPIKKLSIYDENSNQRPVAIMIDNNIGNNYHSGLQDSYLNYEIIVEGGLTRIMAIYKDKDIEQIGPIRSARHYFIDYAQESDSIYIHFGWSPYAEVDIKNLNINNINGLYDEYPFWRASNLYAPHNVFTSLPKIYEYATRKSYKTTSENWKLMKYSTEEINLNDPVEYKQIENPKTGKKEKIPITNKDLITANSVEMSYSDYQIRSYEYDSKNKYYLRYMNNEAHIDYDTKTQLHYKNILIIYVENKQIDIEGRQDLNTVGTGTGYYLTNGYALPINWSKASRTAKTKYTYAKDNKEIILNDGNTFIQIIPANKEIIIK